MERKSFIKSLTALLSLPLTSIPEALGKMGEEKDIFDGKRMNRYVMDEVGQWGIYEPISLRWDEQGKVRVHPDKSGNFLMFHPSNKTI